MSKCPSSAAEMARILGLSRRQFDRLVRAGVLPKVGPRTYDLAAVVQAFISHIERGKTGPGLARERERLTREQADKLALENSVKRGELVYADQVGDSLATVLVGMVGALEAAPGRYADQFTGIASRGAARAKLLEIMRGLRVEFADAFDKLADRLAKGQEP